MKSLGHVYREVAAQLVFMAWLQRVVNGGGIIDREYGVGRGRIDVLVRWPLPGAKSSRDWQKEVFELKVWAEGKPDYVKNCRRAHGHFADHFAKGKGGAALEGMNVLEAPEKFPLVARRIKSKKTE